MKLIYSSIILCMMFILTTNNLLAQGKIKTDTVSVLGNCGQCKERIEEAAYIKGVKYVEWNKTTKVLTVKYNVDKATLDKIEMSIAKAGHDTRDHKASDKEYKQLPGCCAYRDGKCDHD